MAKKTKITLEDITNQFLNIEIKHNKQSKPHDLLIKNTNLSNNILNLENMEQTNIKLALMYSNGSIFNAAKKLGVSRTTLWRKMKKYNIQVTK